MNTRKLRFHSITFKNAAMAILIGLILILCLSMVWPRLFYFIAKNELNTYITSSIRECSVRMSYLLSHHRPTMSLRKNEAVNTLMKEYINGEAGQEETNGRMQSYLLSQSNGVPGGGSILSTSYSLVATERGECFYHEDDTNLARAFMESGALQKIYADKRGNYYSDEYYLDSDGKCYTPVMNFKLDGSDTDFFCFIGAFDVEGVTCYAVSLTPFADVYTELNALNEIGLHDFALYCGGFMLFQNVEESSYTLPSVENSAHSGKQYEVVQREYKDYDLFYVLCSYPSEKFYLAANVTQEQLISPYKNFFYILELCICLLILLIVFIFSISNYFTFRRLRKLDHEMNKVRSGDFDIVLKDNKLDEIGNIVKTINMMVNTIKTNLEQQIASEKLEKDMQYSLLVSAMDPHFIYNTLDTITFLAAMNKCKDIMIVNNALIGTLKDRLKMKQLKIYDTVENEKKVAEQYMIIENYLYSGPIDFRFIADEKDYELQIPKNIIQPLIENAIKHGLMPNKDRNRTHMKEGQIIICVKRSREWINISVTDNGVGMSEEMCRQYLGKISPAEIDAEHIGIMNLRLRLSYLYQDNFRFHIQSPETGGTIVTIELPQVEAGIADY